MPKARREGNLGVPADRFPAKGVTLPTSQLHRCVHTTRHESIIATQVTMLSISRNMENSVRGTYYTTTSNYCGPPQWHVADDMTISMEVQIVEQD